MAENQPDPPRSDREQALERLKKRRDFHGRLVAYVVVNAAMWGLWAATGQGYLWPAWITGLWTIGLVMNAWDAYARSPITEADVQREIEHLRHEH